MRSNESDFIDKIGKILENSNNKTMILIVASGVYVEANYFTYTDMQKFMYLLSRTSCEWYIYPSARVDNGVQLKIRLF